MNNKNPNIFTACYIAAMLAFALPSRAHSETLEDVSHNVKTPDELANLMSNKFESVWRLNDIRYSPQELLRLKQGNCEDMAIMASEILGRMGVKNDILIVKFKDLKIGHAVCIWKDENGSYKFMSDNKIILTGRNDIKEAIEKFYPDWEKIIFMNKEGIQTKVIARAKEIRDLEELM